MTSEEFHESLSLLDQRAGVSLSELALVSGLTPDEIRELADYGVFSCSGEETFSANSIILARVAVRLKQAFELNTAGVALALTYLERIQELERRLRELECRLLG